MNNSQLEAEKALRRAKIALKAGNRRSARHFAQFAASIQPDLEEPWLILAALSTPNSSIKHLNRALRINPDSEAAIKGLDWANQKIDEATSTISASQQKPRLISPLSAESFTQTRSYSAPWVFLTIIILGILLIWYRIPLTGALLKPAEVLPAMQFQIDKETRTPTFTFTFTPLPTSTQTPVPTATPKDTEVPSVTPSNTPKPTKKPTSKPSKNSLKRSPKSKAQIAKRPKGVGPIEHWVDVDLSSQTAHALSGDDLLKSFVVSTGTWMHPTVTGTYKVYVKYRYANMSGPGYFLPNVPFVMYFYKDYGLHGTYWHHNFGTPMSHGCINFKTDDAAWLFTFASIGTIVNIHQ